MMKRIIPVVIVLVVAIVAIAAITAWHFYDDNFAVRPPEFAKPTATKWLSQGWEAPERIRYHHTDQGTQTFAGMPYEWFMALNQPYVFQDKNARLSDPAYLDRFGFIPDGENPSPEKLPVGFAHGDDAMLPNGQGQPRLNPATNKPFTRIGLTCAACHTGRLTYKGQQLLVDGGPALTNLGQFSTAVGVSLLYTRWVPGRLGEFEDRVLGKDASKAARDDLKQQVDAMLAQMKTEAGLGGSHKRENVAEGFGRLDALNRIGNQVFAIDTALPENFAATNAPVHFPRIWQDPWFLWVQYNGSIMQPMVRNAGEALGVRAPFVTSGPNRFASTVKVANLDWMENLLAGQQPDGKNGFSGLKAPLWSDTPFDPVKPTLAQQGAKLYADRCEGCHMPATSDQRFWTQNRWVQLPDSQGKRFLDLEMIPFNHVGTDPAQAATMNGRTVNAHSLGIDDASFGLALGDVVERVAKHWYDTQQPVTDKETRERMNGNRPNQIRAVLGYKMRPLDGIWAAPPYLHNGAVPSVYALLSPVNERPRQFITGNREYDPKVMGYEIGPFKRGFEFDTCIPGNSNWGHEFANKEDMALDKDHLCPRVAQGTALNRLGVIGPKLTVDERMALIEYLKTLGEPPKAAEADKKP